MKLFRRHKHLLRVRFKDERSLVFRCVRCPYAISVSRETLWKK